MEMLALTVLFLLVDMRTAYDFGYSECTYNTYRTQCHSNGYQLHKAGSGLHKFPPLDHKEVCLKIANNEITAFPSDLEKFSTLKTLDVSVNRIETLPDDLYKLNHLEVLDVAENRISTLSNSVKFPVTLEALILRGNGLRTMPEGIEIPNLFVLDLSDNLFTDITRHFCVSSELIRVDFTKNSALSDITQYIDVLNSCRNVNKIQFCLFTDREYVKCSCDSLEKMVVSRSAFQMGTLSSRKHMQCSGTASVANFTGMELFDVETEKVAQVCSLSSQKTASHGNLLAPMITIITASTLAAINLVRT